MFEQTEFSEFPKIARLNRECFITEKIDGTNAQIYIADDRAVMKLGDKLVPFLVGSRTRWITPDNDNFGFARWAYQPHIAEQLLTLGPGRHYGEWWGAGIQRGYGLKEKRFSLFNVGRWTPENTPECVSVVPILYRGMFTTEAVSTQIERLRTLGSVAAPGFMKPEGIVVYHTAANSYFKVTLEKDEVPKSMAR